MIRWQLILCYIGVHLLATLPTFLIGSSFLWHIHLQTNKYLVEEELFRGNFDRKLKFCSWIIHYLLLSIAIPSSRKSRFYLCICPDWSSTVAESNQKINKWLRSWDWGTWRGIQWLLLSNIHPPKVLESHWLCIDNQSVNHHRDCNFTLLAWGDPNKPLKQQKRILLN